MAPPNWLCLSKLLSATKKGGCHVSRRSACGCGRIGSRTTFQRSYPGTAHAGDRNQLCHQRFWEVVVRSSLDCKCWRRLLLSKSVTSLAACLQRIFPCEPSYLFDCMRMRCVAFWQHISGKIESCSSGHCAIIFGSKDQRYRKLGHNLTPKDDREATE